MATVLVVDDEFGVGQVIEAILEDAGHEVRLAVNGKQAMQKLAEKPADLVVTDFMMPILDGAGLFTAIRAEPGLAATKVVLMSSLPEEAILEKISGYDGFLRKPFKIADVINMVEKVLSKSP